MPIYVEIDEELEKKFRIEVLKRIGHKSGALRIAIEEAIKKWLKENDK